MDNDERQATRRETAHYPGADAGDRIVAALDHNIDNLAVFDAHDKKVVRVGEELIPFDVIPTHPQGGFLEFIDETLRAGGTLTTKRSTRTSDR